MVIGKGSVKYCRFIIMIRRLVIYLSICNGSSMISSMFSSRSIIKDRSRSRSRSREIGARMMGCPRLDKPSI